MSPLVTPEESITQGQVVLVPEVGDPLTLGITNEGVGIWMPREGNDSFWPITPYDEEYAESADTEGARRIRSRPQNAIGAGTVYVSGINQTEFATYLDAWQTTVETMRRDGGTIEYTPPDSSVTTTFDVRSFMTTEAPYDGVALRGYVAAFGFEFTCKPYGRLPAEDIALEDLDPFVRDTIANQEWTVPTGSGTIAVSGGQLVPSSTAEKRLIRHGLSMEDGFVAFKFTSGGTSTNTQVGPIIKYIDSNNFIYIRLAATALTVRKVDGGVETQLATVATSISASTPYWISVSTLNTIVAASVYGSDPTADPAPAAIASVVHVLAGGDATKYGTDVWGGVGLRLTPHSTNERYDDFRARSTVLQSSRPAFRFDAIDVPGHVSALADLTITDVASQNRRHIEGGAIGGREFEAERANDPPVLLDSDVLVTSGFTGTGGTRTGAYDPAGAGNSVITASVGTTTQIVCGTGDQRHIGVHRIKARIWSAPSAAGGTVWVRLVWRDGDGAWSRDTAWQSLTSGGTWNEVDLGIVRPTESSAGTQRWDARIEAYASLPASTLEIDYVEIIPAAASFKSRAITDQGAAAFVGYDTFAQVAGNLATKTAEAGGTWAGAGDADDFAVEATGHTLQRTIATADSAISNGRFALLGASTYKDVTVQAEIKWTAMDAASDCHRGVLANYIDTNNWVSVGFGQFDSVETLGRAAGFIIRMRQAGVDVSFGLSGQYESPFLNVSDLWYKAKMQITSAGQISAWFAVVPNAFPAEPQLQVQSNGLASLAAGKIGLYDAKLGGTAATRSYDNFAAWVPEVNYPLFSGRSARIRSEDAIRQNAAGTLYGDMPAYTGSRLRLQPGDTRIALKARRNDVDDGASPDDNVSDAIRASLQATPRVALLG